MIVDEIHVSKELINFFNTLNTNENFDFTAEDRDTITTDEGVKLSKYIGEIHEKGTPLQATIYLSVDGAEVFRWGAISNDENEYIIGEFNRIRRNVQTTQENKARAKAKELKQLFTK